MNPCPRTIFAMVFFIVVSMISCKEKSASLSEDDKSVSNAPSANSGQQLNPAVPESLSEEDMFERFFGDRAQFFVIDNPLNNLHGSDIDKIVLYYLDGELCQTKYFLKKNISHKLINENPSNVHAQGSDAHNQQILEKEKWMWNSAGKWHLNSKLDNYELIWNFPSKQITLRVNHSQNDSSCLYVERLPNYDKLYKAIEQGAF